MEHHSTQAKALAASTAPPQAPTSATGGSGSGGDATQGSSSTPPAKSRRSCRGGKGSGGQGSSGQASGGPGSQPTASSNGQNRTTVSWPSFYNPWTGTIQMCGLHWRPCLRAFPSRLSWRSSTPSSRRRPPRPWSMLPSGLRCPPASSPRRLVPRPGISSLWHRCSVPWR